MDTSKFIALQQLHVEERAEVWEAVHGFLQQAEALEACVDFVRERFDKAMDMGGWCAATVRVPGSEIGAIGEAVNLQRQATNVWVYQAVTSWVELWHERNPDA